MIQVKEASILHNKKLLAQKDETLKMTSKQLLDLSNVHNAMEEKNEALEERVNELYKVIAGLQPPAKKQKRVSDVDTTANQQPEETEKRNITILEDESGYHPKIWNNAALTIPGDAPEGSGPYLPAWQRR